MATLAPLRILITGEDQYTKEFNKMTKKLSSIGKAAEKVGRTMTAALTIPILGVGAAGIKMSNDINKTMANVGTLIPGQSAKLRRFKNEVMDLGKEFGVNSNIMGDGLYQVISAIGDTADSMQVLKISAMAAKAGVSETKDAVNLLTKVSTAYGNTSADMIQRVSDLSFLAVKLGVTTFPELAASMGNIASTAQGMGVSVTELYADTAALTKVLGDTSQAATAMDSVMSGLMLGGTAMNKVFKKLKVSGGNELISKFGGLTGALQAMKEQVGGSEIALKQLFGRKEAQKAAGLLTGSLAQIVADNKRKMTDASGATVEAFKEQTDGINKAGFAFDRFSERLRVMAIRIGDQLAPKLNQLLDRFEPLIDKISNMSSGSLTLGIKIAGVVAAIGPMILIVGKLTTAVSAAMSIIAGSGGLAGIAAILTGPIGITIAAVAGLTAAVAYFWDEIEPLRRAVLEPIRDVLSDISELFESTGGTASSFTRVLKTLVSVAAKLTAPIVKFGMKLALLPLRHIIKLVTIATDVIGILGKAFNVVSSAVGFAFAWLGKLWRSFTEGTEAGRIIKSMFDSIGEAIEYVSGLVKDVWGAIRGFFEDIGVELDAAAMRLDKAAEAQRNADPFSLPGGDVWTGQTFVDQSVMQSIDKGRSESSFNIEITGLPSGAEAKVTRAKGGKAKIRTKGPVMDGAI